MMRALLCLRYAVCYMACMHTWACLCYAYTTLCYMAQPTFRQGNDLELSRWARYNHMIPKSRELSPTGSRREARESQCMRRIQCTTAAWRQTGPPDKGCGWPLEAESSSWPTAKKMGSWVLQPERTVFHHQHEWPWKQIFSLSLQIKGQSSWNLTVDLWSPEHRTQPSSQHCWTSELVSVCCLKTLSVWSSVI